MSSVSARAALSHRICTGLPRRRLGKLIEELAGPWLAQQESRLRDRRGWDRLRAEGHAMRLAGDAGRPFVLPGRPLGPAAGTRAALQ